MKYNKITILDFETGYTHIKTIPEELKNKTIEEIVEELGFNSNDTQFMITREVKIEDGEYKRNIEFWVCGVCGGKIPQNYKDNPVCPKCNTVVD